ncbi:HalOD1 output domain-containing protein [Haloterrigena salifodinae]|uniref:HalOD1 output domain-containing protein n=1 Tax=Haloterrigena salifodinae TaxID=2675099 RepID=UPI000F860505|nr:HalOD1 output domain-containing protein [Haloterrigena salifodinae]
MNGLFSDHECSPIHRVHFEPTNSGQLSSAIVCAISTVADRSPRDIGPLWEAIDPEALERLLDHAAARGAVASVGLEFSVDEFDIVVTDCGEILVYGDSSDYGSDDDLEFTFDG